ncbi:MAG: four helix bundle protein [Bacteroidota bacterium]
MAGHNFKNLKIWKEGMNLVTETYDLTGTFPKSEKYSLASQMIRPATSFPSNIAEGSNKSSHKPFRNYLENSRGSAFQWDTQLNVAFLRNYVSEEKFISQENKVQQIEKMISGYKNGLHD